MCRLTLVAEALPFAPLLFRVPYQAQRRPQAKGLMNLEKFFCDQVRNSAVKMGAVDSRASVLRTNPKR